MKYLVGIDCSIESHSVFILNEEKEKVVFLQIENNLRGFQKLKNLLALYPNHFIGFELAHGPLIDFLRSIGEINLFSVNPLKIKRFKETYIVSSNKTDPIDAHAIALYLLINGNCLRKMIFDSPIVEKLKVLRVTYGRLTKDHARYLNRLRFIIRQYFPLFDYLFTTFGCKVMLEMLLEYPKWGDLKEASNIELRDFLILKNYRVKKYMDRIIARIQNYDQMINESEEFALSLEAGSIIQILMVIKNDLSKIRIHFKEILEQHVMGDLFLSLPGAGYILGGQLLAIWGDNQNRFSKANQVQSLIGTAPCNFSSGKMKIVKIRRACNKHARATLYTFSFTSLRYCSWAREYYDMQRKKGKTHSVALRALSNIWVRRIFFMWKNTMVYNEEQILTDIGKHKKSKVA